MNTQPLSHKIDREQVRQQLVALGYKKGDRVFLRAFFPDTDPRKKDDPGRKAEAENLDQVIAHATRFQAQGRGVYLVVNGGGHKNEDVAEGRAIFYEHDNLDKAAQIELWKNLGLPEPSLQIDTGGKSIHSYWIFAEPIAIENWLLLQKDLLEFADADRSIKNASRVMRLAGAWHTSGKQSVIINNSGKRYIFEELREIIPTPKAPEPTLFQSLPQVLPTSNKTNRYEDVEVPVPIAVPLECALGKKSKELLQGVSDERNTSMAALARDLLGTASEFARLGQTTNDDAYTLFIDACKNCSTGGGWDEKEWNQIWDYAEGKNPSPSNSKASTNAVENCIKSWYWENHGKNNRTVSNVITHPRFTPPDPAEVTKKFAKIYEAGLTGYKLTTALRPLGSNSQQTRRDYEEYVEEADREEQRQNRKADIENLLNIDKRRLTIEKYLPSDLANPIKKVATWMGVDAEAILTFLLPTAASLLNPKSCIVAKECTNFKQPFVLYTGTVALTGDRKTPALDVVKNPLVQLQMVEDARYQQALQLYEAEMQKPEKIKKDKGNDELPQKPKPPREFYVDNATVESLDKIKGQQPEHGLISIKDELSGLFASHGAYKGGKGADKESYLSGWNGGGVKKNRAGDGSRVSLARDSLSITGGIQPDKLRALLGDFNDSQGEWARFLWYHMPTRPYKIPRDDTSYSLDGLLAGIYKKIDALPILKLHFEKLGQTHFDDWYDAKDIQKRAEVRPGLRAAIAKMPGQAVRLIGILHVLNTVSEGEVPPEISLATVQAGCQLADFYLGQVTLLQSNGDALSGELTPVLKAILDKVQDGRSALTARDVLASMRELRGKTASQIRELFVELAAMDLVDTQGKGSRLALVPKSADKKQNTHNPDSTGDVENITSKLLTTADKLLTTPKQVESQLEQGLQEIDCKSADSADAFNSTENTLDCPKVEFDNVTDTSSADKNGSFKESVSTSALDAESSTQQGDKGADSPSAGCQQPSATDSRAAEPIVLGDNPSEPEPSQTAPEATPTTPATGVKPAIKKGDRVVIARSDSPRYRGVKGEVIDDNIWGANGLEFHIRFDKKISNILQDYFPATDVMREPC